jgi:hypothetical protein
VLQARACTEAVDDAGIEADLAAAIWKQKPKTPTGASLNPAHA